MNKPLALGVVKFVQMALYDHQRQFMGVRAKSVILHPESFADFVCRPEVYFSAVRPGGTRPDQSVKFQDVWITPSYESGTPKLINCKNEVIYL